MADASKLHRRSLSQECRFLKGVGPARAERLRRLGIETLDDLITHFPRKYYDRRNFAKISALVPGEDSGFVGQILSVAGRSARGRRSVITAAVGDDTGIVQVVWFNQPYLSKVLKAGNEIIVTGELSHLGERGRSLIPSSNCLEPTWTRNSSTRVVSCPSIRLRAEFRNDT